MLSIVGVSSQSLSSEASSDYVVPPEDVSITTSDSELLEPRQKVFKLNTPLDNIMLSASPVSLLAQSPVSHLSQSPLSVLPPAHTTTTYSPKMSPVHKV